MTMYVILADMKGDLLAQSGNIYNNFQMLGYVESHSHLDAIKAFFDQPQFPIDWHDISYMWAESLDQDIKNSHYGELHKIYISELLQ